MKKLRQIELKSDASTKSISSNIFQSLA